MSQSTLATQSWTTAQLTAFGRDLGSGATFPTLAPDGSALRRGDAFGHTTYGLHFWGGAAWRQRGPLEVTATQRAALSTAGLYNGFQVFETDTYRTWQWNGAWGIILGGPGIRVTKAGTTPVGAAAWTPITWDNLGAATPLAGTGMYASGNPTRLVAPAGGRYRVASMASGATNYQIRQNAAGVAAAGSMLAGINNLTANSAAPLIADEVIMAASDHVEMFGYQNTATNVGTSSGYTAYFTLSYLGPAW